MWIFPKISIGFDKKKPPLPDQNAIKIETQNAIDWANFNYKKHHDWKNSPLFLKTKNGFFYKCTKIMKFFF